MSFESYVGHRYLRSGEKQTFLSVITILSTIGIAVGVMVLIIVNAVMTGFESDLRNRILGVESHIIVMKQGGPFSGSQEVMERIEGTPGVVSASPFIYSQIMIRTPGGMSGVVLRGIDPKRDGSLVKVKDHRSLQEVLSEDEGREGEIPGLVVGKVAGKKLGISKGDIVYLISTGGPGTALTRLPATNRFEVKGFFDTGMHEYDASMVYMRLERAQKILNMKDQVTGIGVRVKEIPKAREISGEIVSRLDFPFWARDWMRMNRNLFSMLRLQKTVMFIIMALIVLVAVFNIASTLIMMVLGKTRDIAIMKTMGATNKNIRRIFVFKGMLIGAIGAAAGLVLGVAACLLLERYKFIDLPGDVYFLNTLPVELAFPEVVFILLFVLAICFFASLLPARKAAKFNPVDGIRYGG
ncbi:MAG: lipoprotein-releasing ABC transporter permease subunit [Desulfobacterales bacterium]|nr:lipoprotein-releasing ABC transporter permease subunit [Desulfobacterales bacterium]